MHGPRSRFFCKFSTLNFLCILCYENSISPLIDQPFSVPGQKFPICMVFPSVSFPRLRPQSFSPPDKPLQFPCVTESQPIPNIPANISHASSPRMPGRSRYTQDPQRRPTEKLLDCPSSNSRPRTISRQLPSVHKSDHRSQSPARRDALEETYAVHDVSLRASPAGCTEHLRMPAEKESAAMLERLAVRYFWNHLESERCCDRYQRHPSCAFFRSRGSNPRPTSSCTWRPTASSAWRGFRCLSHC